MENKTFIEITNKDIYEEIKSFKRDNAIQHQQILLHQKVTNGKVKANRWMITTIITIGITLFTVWGIS